jgi:beta-lactam-binding protein with PASTA domain
LRGPLVVVPNVRGQTLAKASTRIRKVNCRVGRIAWLVSPRRNRGRVLAEKPKPGATLRGGAKIQLIVGKGPKK